MRKVDLSRQSLKDILQLAGDSGDVLIDHISGHRRESSGKLAFHIHWMGHSEPMWQYLPPIHKLRELVEYCVTHGINVAAEMRKENPIKRKAPTVSVVDSDDDSSSVESAAPISASASKGAGLGRGQRARKAQNLAESEISEDSDSEASDWEN